jgi:hypothetical protein
MSTPALIMWAVVLLVGVPSAWRNPTAAALVLCWIFGEVVFVLTGNSLPVKYYAYPDIFVIAVIFAKGAYQCQYPYRSLWHQLECIVLERSPADRVVMLIFPVMWALYISALHPYYLWYALWGLTIVQFLAAGWEAFSSNRRAPKAVSDAPDIPFGSEYRFARARGYG